MFESVAQANLRWTQRTQAVCADRGTQGSHLILPRGPLATVILRETTERKPSPVD